MLIGVPKEIKNHEYRVGLTPAGSKEVIAAGHQVLVETNAGAQIGFSDQQYLDAGANIAKDANQVYGEAEMIVKVKEPQQSECAMIRQDQVIFSYLHLAAEPELTEMLVQSKSVAIAFETVTDHVGGLPLLAPMSEVAGKISIQAGAKALEKAQGGRGVLLGGVPGVAPAKVTVVGGGVAGTNAAKVAIGMGANVTILDRSLPRIRYLSDIFGNSANILYSTTQNIADSVIESDLVVGSVLIPGASAPKLVTREMIRQMNDGSVITDIAIDQGGCFETSRPTSHSEPTYVEEGVVHYCVTNMPGAVALTSTLALQNATLHFAIEIANKGYKQALKDNVHLLNGLNVYDGRVTYQAVAKDLGYQYQDPANLF